MTAQKSELEKAFARIDRLLANNDQMHQDKLRLQRRLAAAEKAADDAVQRLETVRRLRVDETPVVPWTAAKRTQKAHRGTPTLLLSDMHFDELVNPDQVEGVNAYDRSIAQIRLKCLFDSVIKISRTYVAGLKLEGICVMLGGDGLSGNIHDELRETNADTILGSYAFWRRELQGFLEGLAEEFGRVHVAGVVGNHGRNTRKPVHKNRVRDNFDWLLLDEIAYSLRADRRFSWQIPTSADVLVRIYDTKVKLTHGDQFHGGGGIAGILSPISLGQHRKSRRDASIGNPWDLMALGHFHQYLSTPSFIVNGSLKGLDEYAYDNNFAFEAPRQAFWITTPEHGVTFSAPIYVQDRKKEQW